MSFCPRKLAGAGFLVLFLSLFNLQSEAQAASPAELFSFKEVDQGLSVFSANPWETQTYKVGIRKNWLKKSFVFNAPGGRSLFADSSHKKNSKASASKVVKLNGYTISTSSGKLFPLRRTSYGKKLRAGRRSKAGTYIISEVQGPDGHAVQGIFHAHDGREYRLESDNHGKTFRLLRINSLKEPSCAGDLIASSGATIPASVLHQHSAGEISTKAHATVKVLVVYSASARSAAGSDAAMLSQINSMFTYANIAYVNSGIDADVQLAAALPLNGPDEVTSFSTNLNRITSKVDGFWDDVHTQRTEYGADMVAMIVNSVEYCGLAWVAPGSKNNAFSVINRTCTSSFAHELGHNFGAMHDIANAGGAGPYAYGYGWRFNGNTGTQYRTVMSYAPGNRIPHFSNPDVSYDGQPSGVAGSANNALVHNTTMSLAAAFFSDVVATPTPSATATRTSTPPPGSTATFTATPSTVPTTAPTAVPTTTATAVPTSAPTSAPTAVPTSVPTTVPTPEPTMIPPTETETTLGLSRGVTTNTKSVLLGSVMEGGIGVPGELVRFYKRGNGNRYTFLKTVRTGSDGLARYSVKLTKQTQTFIAQLVSDPSIVSGLLRVGAAKLKKPGRKVKLRNKR